MTNINLYGIISAAMVRKEAEGRGEVTFGETLNPNVRRISANGRYVGIMLLDREEIVVEWFTKRNSAVRTPMHLLEAIVREKDRIVKEKGQRE